MKSQKEMKTAWEVYTLNIYELKYTNIYYYITLSPVKHCGTKQDKQCMYNRTFWGVCIMFIPTGLS